MSNLRINELFAGYGTVSIAMRDAGIGCSMAIDSWKSAVANQRANGWSRSQAQIGTDPITIGEAEFAWASPPPPCTAFSNGSNNREKRHEVNALVIHAMNILSKTTRHAICIENHQKLPKSHEWAVAVEVARQHGFLYAQELVI